ncbi:uncharacterized protein LOC133085660 [Eubalaena glacialis]|uniref:uncharacterized protein LOC133085660 n=1 Tax=Eubalaena glacialis TaxID=27606 RepID=UPI002A5A71D4|nr:uncharacterized protein LOC133085660 [Eubalaena glacialis]
MQQWVCAVGGVGARGPPCSSHGGGSGTELRGESPLRGQPCAGGSARPAYPGENSPRQAARSPPSAVLGPKRTLQWDMQAGNTWQHAALSPARQLVRSDGAAATDGAGPSCPDTRFGPRTQESKLMDQRPRGAEKAAGAHTRGREARRGWQQLVQGGPDLTPCQGPASRETDRLREPVPARPPEEGPSPVPSTRLPELKSEHSPSGISVSELMGRTVTLRCRE